MNYSLLIMESAGMMKLATGEGSPLRQGAGTGSRLVFCGYRGLRRRNSRSILFSGGFSIYRNFWRRSHVKEVPESSTRQGPTPSGVGAPSTLVDSSGLFWPNSFALEASFGPKKSSKIGTSIGLRLVFLFCKTQKQGKNRNWHWALG